MSTQYVGEVRLFGGNYAPVGWAFCDGSMLSISGYPVLYNLIGTTYGGNGQTTFGLPDMRGRALIAQGTGTGLSPYVMGEQVGVPSVTVVTGQMASHPHSFGGNTGPATSPTPGPGVVLAAALAGDLIYDGTATPIPLSSQAVTTTGGSLPHNNLQPYLAISYIIALEGVYPSQN